VLTDGNEYRIYNAHAPVHVDDKLFRKVSVASDSPLLIPTLELLAKDRMAENRIEVLWRAQFVDHQVKSALEEMFTHDGDLLVVNYVAGRTKNLDAEEIRSSLHRCRATFDFPVPTDVKEVSPPAKKAKKSRTGGKHTVIDVTIADLIRAGLIRPPIDLERKYKGTLLRAKITKDGNVTFNSKTYGSSSLAGGAARATVIGLKAGGKLPSTNGWTFWHIKSASGKPAPLDELRGRYLASKGTEKTG